MTRTTCERLFRDRDVVKINADRVVGFMPAPRDPRDKVIMLYNPPSQATRIVLREGGWLLPLPTRASLLTQDFVVLFTLMTKPGNRIVRTDILEFRAKDPYTIDIAIQALAGAYRNFEAINLSGVVKRPIKTSNYEVKWVGEKNWVVFEPVL